MELARALFVPRVVHTEGTVFCDHKITRHFERLPGPYEGLQILVRTVVAGI